MFVPFPKSICIQAKAPQNPIVLKILFACSYQFSSVLACPVQGRQEQNHILKLRRRSLQANTPSAHASTGFTCTVSESAYLFIRSSCCNHQYTTALTRIISVVRVPSFFFNYTTISSTRPDRPLCRPSSNCSCPSMHHPLSCSASCLSL